MDIDPAPTDENLNSSDSIVSPPPFYSKKTVRWVIICLIILLTTLLIWRWFSSSSTDRHRMPQSVVTANAHTGNVPIYITALGTVTPTLSVTVRTQVSGQLLQVLFKEGQLVKRGDLLAQIDSRTFQAQLSQFQGQLARDQALLANAVVDLKRDQTLWRENSVAKQALDTQAALVKQYEGTIKLDEGQIRTAQLNIEYSNITAPIDGRVGLRLVDQGNFVQTSDANGLVVINTINPITVIFSIPEDEVPKISDQINNGKQLTVQAYDRSQNQLLASGLLLTMDNQIDPGTGTIKLKALFTNDHYHLFPNQFVNIKLLINTLQNATLIPTAALQYGTNGNYVFRVNSNDTVTMVAVKAGAAFADDTAIVSGISPGQSVVIAGADKLINGAKISLPNANTEQAKTRHKKR